jgi:hypothetical protein
MKRYWNSFEEGYDSNGKIGPFSNVVEDEGPQIFDEDALTNQPQPTETVNPGDTPDKNESSINGHVPIDRRTLDAMGKNELIVELKKRGQAIGGKKGDLYNCLQKALDAKAGVAKPGQFRATKKKKTTTTPGPDNLNGFAPGSHWVPLVPIATPIDKPENPNFPKARAPTVSEDKVDVVQLKHNFSKKFDRPLFTGTHVSKKLLTQDEKGQPK